MGGSAMKGKPRGVNPARILRPSMRLYFFVILAFAAAAVALRYWYLAMGELGVALLLFLYSKTRAGKGTLSKE